MEKKSNHGEKVPKCLRDVITASMRKKIVSGEWPVNRRIPSNELLTAQYRTSIFTLHKAMTPLVAEGLLERTRRLGTFVASDTPRVAAPVVGMGALGVLHHIDIEFINDGAGVYHQLLLRALRLRLSGEETPSRFWLPAFHGRDDPGPIDDIAAAWRAGEIRGLAIVNASDALLDGVRALAIPHAVSASRGEVDMATFDSRYFAELALGELARNGARRIGVIGSLWRPGEPALPGERPGNEAHTRFFAGFRDALARFGLETRAEWQAFSARDFLADRLAPIHPGDEETSFTRFGYRGFARIWDDPAGERPDGLLVLSDLMLSGVVMAMLERRVSVPEELRVVSHKNRGADVHAPFPVRYVCNDVEEMAATLLRMVKGEVRGPSWLPPYLEMSSE